MAAASSPKSSNKPKKMNPKKSKPKGSPAAAEVAAEAAKIFTSSVKKTFEKVFTGIDDAASEILGGAGSKAEKVKPPKSPRSGEPRSHVKVGYDNDIMKRALDERRGRKEKDGHKRKQNKVDLHRGIDL